MKGSSRKTMLLAFLMAAAAAGAVYFLLAARGGQPGPAEQERAVVETGPVVVAARDLPADTMLTEADIQIDQIPVAGRHPDALTDAASALGKVTRSDLVLGEQVLVQRLLSPEDAVPNTFAREVPPGYRAISLSGDEVRLVGGLVQPGDRVDIIGYFTYPAPKADGAAGQDSSVAAAAGESGIAGTPSAAVAEAPAPAAAMYVLQNVEVLSVAQALTPADLGVSGDSPGDAAANAAQDIAASGGNAPVARPDAASVTLLVPAGDVAKLMLAVNTVASNALQMVLRAPGDTVLSVQSPAVTTGDPNQYPFGAVDGAVATGPLRVVSAEFAGTDLMAGENLEFSVTVKNVSDTTIQPGAGGAPDGYTYAEASAWDSEGFFEEDGNLRIALNVAGAPQPYPWRWTLTGPLEPGQEATITGAVTLEQPTTGKRYWFGIVRERDEVISDGIGVAEIRVNPVSVVRVITDGAALREAPAVDAAKVADLPRDAEASVTGREPGWLQVETTSGVGWIEAAAVEPVAGHAQPGSSTGELATPVASGE